MITYVVADTQLMVASGEIHVESTDIGCLDHFLVWMELGRVAECGTRKKFLINPRCACAGGLRYLSSLFFCLLPLNCRHRSFIPKVYTCSTLLGFSHVVFRKKNLSWKVMVRKSQYANEQLPLTTGFSLFRVPCIQRRLEKIA